MYRWIIIEDCDGKQHVIRNISDLYVTYGLPEPTTSKPVFSMEFRERVSRYGFVFESVNNPSFVFGAVNAIEFIPPSQIRRVWFGISEKEDAYESFDQWNSVELLKG